MKKKVTRARRDFSGSTFDSFLEEHGIREEVEAVATKRVLAWQLEQEMKRQRKTKQAMAQELQTSRSQLDRLLDPQNTADFVLVINPPAETSLMINGLSGLYSLMCSCLPARITLFVS